MGDRSVVPIRSKSSRNTATQLCLKLEVESQHCDTTAFQLYCYYWTHLGPHTAIPNGPTKTSWVHSEPGSPAVHYAPIDPGLEN